MVETGGIGVKALSAFEFSCLVEGAEEIAGGGGAEDGGVEVGEDGGAVGDPMNLGDIFWGYFPEEGVIMVAEGCVDLV